MHVTAIREPCPPMDFLSRAAVKKLFLPIFLSCVCFLFYSGIVPYGRLRTAPNQFNYYKDQAIAFLHGQVNITCPEKTHCHDLASYRDSYFLYHPPVPAILMMPAVLIWGRSTPDTLFASISGALNVFFFFILLRLIRKKFMPFSDLPHQTHYSSESIFPLVWGLGTVHYYMSMQGDVWHLAQILGQTFLLLTGISFFAKSPALRAVAGITFALACFTRLNLVTAGTFFLVIMWSERTSLRLFTVQVLRFFAPYTLLSILQLMFNKARFDNFFEPGFSYMKMEVASGVAHRIEQYGKISVFNIPHNFFLEILKTPDFSHKFPFINLNPHGFGMLWATPFFLLLFPVCWRLYRDYRNYEVRTPRSELAVAALCTSGIMALAIFLLPGHGYQQYAARYTLDFQLFTFIAIFAFESLYSDKVMWYLTAASAYMNICGAFLFLRHWENVAGVPG